MFADLIGNEKVKVLLRRLIAAGRLPHAMLFAGPDGVGKKQFALEMGRALVCRSPLADGEACGKCAACERVGVFELPTSDRGEDYDRVFLSAHPDVGLVIPFKRTMRVGAIRELEREANFRPFEARERIFIIDDADRMNDAASNALLKTLEEPPETTRIILVTSRPDGLLATIRSRCQTVRFAPVGSGEIERLLVSSERFALEDAVLASRAASGSVGRALGLDVERFRAERELMFDLLASAIERPDLSAMLRVSEEISDPKNKDRFENALLVLETLIRDVWMLASGRGAADIVNPDLAKQLTSLAGRADLRLLPQWLSDLEDVRAAQTVNINKRIAADALFVQMAAG